MNYKYFIYLFVGFVPAEKEIWVIGDRHMTFVSQHVEYWKELNRRNLHEGLYILRWYDVKAFPPNSSSTNAMEVIISTLVGALNNRPKLPHSLVIMLGDTKFWCNQQALQFTMDTLLINLLMEINKVIQTRQRDLPVKAVGKDPVIFFVKLNWKPENAIDSVPNYPKKRRTFNKLLDTIVKPREAFTIMLHEINERFDKDFFLGHGDLSQKGYRQIWVSLSEAIQDFDFRGHQQAKNYSVMEKHTGDASGNPPHYHCGGDELKSLMDKEAYAVSSKLNVKRQNNKTQWKGSSNKTSHPWNSKMCYFNNNPFNQH